jgi:hypothetical protein
VNLSTASLWRLPPPTNARADSQLGDYWATEMIHLRRAFRTYASNRLPLEKGAASAEIFIATIIGPPGQNT